MSLATSDSEPITRRERHRAATVQEIKQVARRLVVSHGSQSLSLRAIAREMGLTAPALYRYFDGHETLVGALVGDLYDELCDAMTAAQAELPVHETGDPAQRAFDAGCRLMLAACAFRSWSVANSAEFGLVFGTPIPGVDLSDDDSPACQGGRRFGLVFAALFLQLWAAKPFAVPEIAELDPRLIPQIDAYRERLGIDLPVPVVWVFLSCWARLYGLVTMEVFGHLTFALSDAEPAFMTELAQIGVILGLKDDDAEAALPGMFRTGIESP